MVEIKLKYNEVILDELDKGDRVASDLPFPKHGSDVSAGYDIFAASDPEIVGEKNEYGGWNRIDYIQYATGIHVQPPKSNVENGFYETYHTLAFPRSSVSKYNLQLANGIGLIDNDYIGQIYLRYNYIWQPEDFSWFHDGDIMSGKRGKNRVVGNVNMHRVYRKGDAIGQLVVQKTEFANFEVVLDLMETKRGEGGFGSTGK